MSKTIKNLKSGNYEVVDSQGVSITTHFIECLEKEFTDLEAKLAQAKMNESYEKEKKDNAFKLIDQLKQQIAEKEKEETKRMEDFEKGCQEYYKSNQTAIAELEKLRKQLDCEDNYCYGDNNIVICINRTIFNNIIDNQINGLKGEK